MFFMVINLKLLINVKNMEHIKMIAVTENSNLQSFSEFAFKLFGNDVKLTSGGPEAN